MVVGGNRRRREGEAVVGSERNGKFYLKKLVERMDSGNWILVSKHVF